MKTLKEHIKNDTQFLELMKNVRSERERQIIEDTLINALGPLWNVVFKTVDEVQKQEEVFQTKESHDK